MKRKFWFGVEFLGIGWAVAMSLILVISTWLAKQGYTIGLQYNRLGELNIEVWWNTAFWLLGLVAFIRLIRRYRNPDLTDPATIQLRGDLAIWAKGVK